MNDNNLRLLAQAEALAIHEYLNGNIQPSTQLQDPTNFDVNFKGDYTVVSNDGFLNLRYGPGPDYGIIIPMPANSTVSCYGYYSILNNAQWVYVVYKNYVGFCNVAYLRKQVPQPKKQPYCTATVVNTDSLYVRTGPGKEYEPIKEVPLIYSGNRVDICD